MGLSAKEEVSIQIELTGTARSASIQVEHFFRHAKHAGLSDIIPFNISEVVNMLTWMDRVRQFCSHTVVSDHSVCSGSWKVAIISHCSDINVTLDPLTLWWQNKTYLNHLWNAVPSNKISAGGFQAAFYALHPNMVAFIGPADIKVNNWTH